MKKQLTRFFIALCMLVSLNSQAQNWIWANGINTTDDIGVYGTLGTQAPTNKPGGRGDYVTWKDANGVLWLFGGYGRANSIIVGFLNDLWKYDPIANQWTWVNGANTRNQVGNYGTINVTTSTNRPGARRYATGWADGAGNLYLFGGFGYAAAGGTNRLNDLWKYNTITNEWTWISGASTTNQVGDYTTIGSLRPGARQRSHSWFDGTNAWIFAGEGFTSTSAGTLNDLWKYNPTTNAWSFVAGDNATNVVGVYGTLGSSAATNKPGSRESGATWKDGSGNLWLFGGGFSSSAYNDLWKFDIITNEWTWINGSNTNNQFGDYGLLQTASPTNNPGSRRAATALMDNTGVFWLVGGNGYSESSTGSLNDVWQYRPTDNTWIWSKGSKNTDVLGIYGTQNVSASTNVLGGRYGSGGWMSPTNNMIIFGGNGFSSLVTSGYLNDVWTLGTAALLPIQLMEFSAVKNNMNVDLKWVTQSEMNNEYFELLHATDGIHFEIIAKVNGKGNSNEMQSYFYTHNNPNFNLAHYYQLKQVDVDGKSSLSAIIKVINTTTSQLEVNAYLNPYKQLMVNTSNNKSMTIHIFDINGKCLSNQRYEAGSTASIDLSHFANGFYIAQVVSQNEMKSVKFEIK